MGKVVDVDAAIEAMQDVVTMPVYEFGVLCDKLEALTVDAEPVKHGRWIETKYYDEHFQPIRLCTSCKNEHGSDGALAYCPNCGASMDQEVAT